MSAVAESTRTGTPPTTPPDDSALARAGAWARRAPLLPALIFMIVALLLLFASVWIGLASVFLLTLTSQPGAGS